MMTTIQNPLILPSSTNYDTSSKQQNQKIGLSDFDVLLSNTGATASAANTSLDISGSMRGMVNGLANKFLLNITDSATDVSDRNLISSDSATFPFTSDFDATFGSSGPLIDFINMITSKLNLTAEQNNALQDIAVRHKDITNTTANVSQIALELQQAGIA
jgi:hypothetical protein